MTGLGESFSPARLRYDGPGSTSPVVPALQSPVETRSIEREMYNWTFLRNSRGLRRKTGLVGAVFFYLQTEITSFLVVTCCGTASSLAHVSERCVLTNSTT